jgi:hypothetical protein
MNRLAILLAAALCGSIALAAPTGCGSGPYTGRPEKLKKPRAKKRPEGQKAPTEVAAGSGAQTVPLSDEQCRTNFFAEPFKRRRATREAESMAHSADAELVSAERQLGPARQQHVVEAMGTLSNALRKDPYAPEPTYKLAVAYALVGRKSCALALLERLKTLATVVGQEEKADLVIQRAARDPAFKQYEKEARTALGQ